MGDPHGIIDTFFRRQVDISRTGRIKLTQGWKTAFPGNRAKELGGTFKGIIGPDHGIEFAGTRGGVYPHVGEIPVVVGVGLFGLADIKPVIADPGDQGKLFPADNSFSSPIDPV